MAVCKKCGAEVSDGAKFCNECGEKIESSSEENKISSNNVYVPDVTLQEMFLKTSGRLNRKRFFKRIMALAAVVITIITFLAALSISIYGYFPESVETLVGIIVIANLIPNYCLMVRRLHDMDKDNTLAIAAMSIHVIYLILVGTENTDNALVAGIMALAEFGLGLYILCTDGTHGENKYGADPLNR